MYSIVFFNDSNEVEVLPSSWVGKNQKTCRFAPSKKKGVMKAIEKCEEADSEWPEYSNITVLKVTDDYQKARQKCKVVAEKKNFSVKSDLDTTDVDAKPRKRSAPSKFSESESESDAGDISPKRIRKVIENNEKNTSALTERTTPLACPELPSVSNIPKRPCQTSTESNIRYLEDDVMDASSVSNASSPESVQTVTSTPELEKLTTALVKTQLMVENNNILLKKLLHHQLAGLQAGDPDQVSMFPLPMKTFEDVDITESLLCTRENRKYLVAFLSAMGGVNVKRIVVRIMRCLFEDKLAKRFNWCGKRGVKQGLGSLKIASVIKARDVQREEALSELTRLVQSTDSEME